MKKYVILILIILVANICLIGQESRVRETQRMEVSNEPAQLQAAPSVERRTVEQQTQHTNINEIPILLNQARLFENRNQFSQALEIYESLLESHPTNESVLEPYFRLLYQQAQFEKATNTLNSIRNRVPPLFFARQETIHRIHTRNIEGAIELARRSIDSNQRNMNVYRDFARIFENAGLFDTSIEIYERARIAFNDVNLFTLELSQAYSFIRDVEKFFEESIRFLRQNSGFLYHFRTRFLDFIREDHTRVDIIETLLKEHETPQVLELFAFCLVEIRDFERATDVYELLPLATMIRFADDLTTDGFIDFALRIYYRALERADTIITSVDIQMKIARIYLELEDIFKSIEILQEIINNRYLQNQNINRQTRVNTEARLLMAMIYIKQDKSIAEVTQWYEGAIQFAISQTERADILFQLSRFLYLNEDFKGAFQIIDRAITGQPTNSQIYRTSFFFRYEIALFEGNAVRDSLLTECILFFPGDQRVSNMLFLETFLNSLNRDDQILFLRAFRFKALFRVEQAVKTLIELHEKSGLEELLLLAYDWADSEKFYDLVTHIESFNFRNPVFRDYIFLQSSRRETDIDVRRQKISQFLNNYPQNVFSPHLRMILFRSS